MAVHYGAHPDQAPTLDHNATDDEIDEFKQVIRDWKYSVKDHKDLILDTMIHEDVDEEQRAKDYKAWHLPYLKTCVIKNCRT